MSIYITKLAVSSSLLTFSLSMKDYLILGFILKLSIWVEKGLSSYLLHLTTSLQIERRIYYDEVEGLTAEWLDNTSTLVLSHSHKRTIRKSSPGKNSKTLDEIALLVYPVEGESGNSCEPAFFPLTLHLLSTIPVALHAVGGDDGPLDIVARLYVSSYFQ